MEVIVEVIYAAQSSKYAISNASAWFINTHAYPVFTVTENMLVAETDHRAAQRNAASFSWTAKKSHQM